MAHTRRLRFTAHCTCGDSIDVRTPYADTADVYANLWAKVHRGEGHRPATPSQAARLGAKERTRELARPELTR